MATIVKEGLTFDDVLLIPQKSEILPSQIDTKTKLTKDIELNIPLQSQKWLYQWLDKVE